MQYRLYQKQTDLRHRIDTVPRVQEEVRRIGVEPENNKDKSSNCDVYVMYIDLCPFLSTGLILKLCSAICISRGLILQIAF